MLRRRYLLSAALVLAIVGIWQVGASLPGADHPTPASPPGASRLATLRNAELPASVPYLFSGIRIAATGSVIGAVFGEWAGADRGLGRLILLGINQLQTPRVYAGVVILMAMALLLFILATV